MDQRIKILIVDDSRLIRQTISDVIKEHYKGDLVEILTADDGDLAIEMIEQKKPSIILLDIMMQRISGLEVLESIKTLTFRGLVTVIMISGIEDNDTLASCFKLGAKDFIRKPVQEVELVARLEGAIQFNQLVNNLHKANQELLQAKNQMVQAEKMAAVGQLAAGIAHEINNPVGFISSNIATLNSYFKTWEKGDEQGFKHVKEDIPDLFNDLNIGIVRIREIVDSLRSFSRIDNLYEANTFDVEQGLKDTLVVARHRYRYYAEVETLFGNIPKITGNGGKLNQVFMNLIINAADAIKSAQDEDGRSGKITIQTTYDDVEDRVYITVEDNGSGMDEEILKGAFNPFFTTKPVGSGTGLGLSVSYDIIVNEHGGTIQAASTIGKGSLFTIMLPVGHQGGL